MKLFTKKKVMQKMTIVLVFLMLFNFITPTYSRAAWYDDVGHTVLNAIAWASLKLGDVAINFMQNIFIGTNAVITREEQLEMNGYGSVETMDKVLSTIYEVKEGVTTTANDVTQAGLKYGLKMDDETSSKISNWVIENGSYFSSDGTPNILVEALKGGLFGPLNLIPGFSESTPVDQLANDIIAASTGGGLGLLYNQNKDKLEQINEKVEKLNDYEDIYKIQISPWKIFSGTIYALNIDFISNPNSEKKDGENANDNWYNEYLQSEKYIKDRIDELKAKSSLTEDENDRLLALTRIYLMTGMKNDNKASVVNWLNTVYTAINSGKTSEESTYSNEGLMAYIAPERAFEGNKNQRDYIAQYLNDSNLYNVFSKAFSMQSGKNGLLNWAAQEENSPAIVLHDIIATWYRILRNIALVALLCILVYVGIRIMISSTAADSAKYKKMLVDWVVAVCILFALHYIMAFSVNLCQLITDAITGSDVDIQTVDEVINEIRMNADGDAISNFGYIMVYLVLVIYTIYFLFYYVKRVVYAAFLTLIAPLVAVTYPVDKMGDGRSQAFDMWVREYVMNIIMQPLHLLIYTTMVTTAITLAKNNPIYAIVVIGAMIPVEKFIKEMFGIGPKKGPNGGPLVGAAVLTGMQKLAGRKPPKFPSHEDKDKGTANNGETSKKPRMDSEKIAELSQSFTNGDENASDNSITPRMKNSNTSTENQPGIDDGSFETPAFGFANSLENDNNIETAENIVDNSQMLPDDGLEGTLNGIEGVPFGFGENSYELEDAGDVSFADLDKYDILGAENGNGDENIDIEPSYEFPRYNTSPIRSVARNRQNNNSQDINNIRINTNNNSSAPKKKRNIKAEAARATAAYYTRKIINFENAKKILKGAAKISGGVVASGVGATVGLAAGVASGDPGKALQFSVAGGFAGAKIGSNTAENVMNTAGFVAKAPYHVVRDIGNTYQENLKERLNYDNEVKKEQKTRANRKYARSSEIEDAIKKRYGYSVLDGKKINAVQSGIERYKNKGIDDLDTIFNCLNLENGMDSQGNDIGEKISQDQAMLVGLMHEQGFDRKAVKEQMKLQFADNYYGDGTKGISAADSVSKAKTKTNEFMKMYDMASGISVEKAGRADIQEELKDAKDEARRLQNIEDQAKAIERANQRAQRRASRESSRNIHPRTPRNQSTDTSSSNRRINPVNPGNSSNQDTNELDSDI